MIKLDFSGLHEDGFRVNQLRLVHSSAFKGKNFVRRKNTFIKDNDLTGEKNLILGYIIERMEICYTRYFVFAGLTFLSFFLLILTLFFPTISITIKLIPFVSVFVCWFVANSGKSDMVMANVGYFLAESMYDFKIHDKYNLK